MSLLSTRHENRALLPDLAEWFEPFASMRSMRGLLDTHLIRVEDRVEKDRYLVRAELPGLDPEKDIRVEVEDGQLCIEAERKEEHQENGRSEFSYGSFSRTVQLPGKAKEDDVDASYAKGILTVSVGLEPTASEPKRIEVKSTE